MPDNKTAMQELIELLDKEIENNFTRDAPVMTQMNQQPYKRIKSRALKLLETERHQIIDAHMEGDMHENLFDAEQYFNEKYGRKN